MHINKSKRNNMKHSSDKITKPIRFTKMHGAGNDYIYIDTMRYPLENPETLAVKWSALHTGIGSDGLVLIGKSDVADFSMRIFNADGSEAMMCGNANGFTLDGRKVSLNKLWEPPADNQIQRDKLYITQRGAEAVYSPKGKKQIQASVDYYMQNAHIMREGLLACGLTVYGGQDAPYIWMKTPGNIDSWTFFEQLLHETYIVGTPGVGFGPSGEGFLRLTAFGDRGDTLEAIDRLKNRLIYH